MIHVAQIHEHKVAGRRLGRHTEHDPRSRAFAHAEVVQSAIKSVSWQRRGAPFDQGDLGSCTGNAMAGALMTGPLYVAGRTLTETDAVAIYSLATTLDTIKGSYPPEDTGSSGLAVCKAAKQKGLIGSYTHAFTMAAALAALQNGPVITGMNWYTSFDSPAPDGLVSLPKGATIRGGHEVQPYGLHVETTAGQLDLNDSRVLIWNSWGTSYGVGGAFSMTLATWGRLLNEGGDVTVPHR